MDKEKLIEKIPVGFTTKFQVLHADITKLKIGAIVNAANENLGGGEGVDGAIHAAAGPELLAECQRIGGCKTGEAVITKGYHLLSEYVIHTVSPKYGSENGNEDELLSNCYQACLSLAFEHNIRSIAFPNLSTGLYRYPKEEAAAIAFSSVREWLQGHQYYNFEKIIFVSFTEEDYDLNVFFFNQTEF